VLKNNCPTTQVAGSEVPTLIGRVTGMAEKSGFFDCVLRFTVVFVWPETTATIQAKQGSTKNAIRTRERLPTLKDGMYVFFVFIKRATSDADSFPAQKLSCSFPSTGNHRAAANGAFVSRRLGGIAWLK
jgi:hypothetical protein